MAMKHLAVDDTDAARRPARARSPRQYDIPIELMAKVLQRLARSGLLTSHQGTRGGYTLVAGRPSSISVADIIQAIDGPLTVTACSTDDEQCEQFTKCNVRDPLWRIKDRILVGAGDLLARGDLRRRAARPEPPARRCRLSRRDVRDARPVYLDYHATTPVDPRVLEAMLPFFTERFGNPAQQAARLRLGRARRGRDARARRSPR